MGIIYSLLLGCLAGFCAGKLMKGGGFGLIMNIVLGLLGGVLGGWLFSLFGLSWGGLLIKMNTIRECSSSFCAFLLLFFLISYSQHFTFRHLFRQL